MNGPEFVIGFCSGFVTALIICYFAVNNYIIKYYKKQLDRPYCNKAKGEWAMKGHAPTEHYESINHNI